MWWSGRSAACDGLLRTLSWLVAVLLLLLRLLTWWCSLTGGGTSGQNSILW